MRFDRAIHSQQLIVHSDLNIYYYPNDNGSCEGDFLVDTGQTIIPVEVKAEVNLRAKSLRTYVEKLSPMLRSEPRSSIRKRNLPLYAIENLTNESI